MSFEMKPLERLPEIVEITPHVFRNERGWFMETYNASDFAKPGDPTINIEWPISKPHLSRKDLDAPTLDDADNNFVWCS